MIYSGKVLINTRNLKPIHSILSSKEPPKGTELNVLLSFLTTYALSDGLFYDDSIPPQYLSAAQSTLHDLGIHKQAKPLPKLNQNELISLTGDSLAMCANEIKADLANPAERASVKNDDCDQFFAYLHKIKNTPNQNSKTEIALDAFTRGQHGGKLLLAFASPNNEELLNFLPFEKLDSEKKNQLMASMIGHFRTFLLSTQAAKNHAFYSTNPEFVQLLEAKNKRAWDVLLREFMEPSGHIKFNEANGMETNRWRFPLVGAAVIIDAKRKGIKPQELLPFTKRFAKEKKLVSLQKELVRRYEGTEDSNDIIERMDNFWDDIIAHEYDKEDCRIALQNDLKYMIAPTAISGFIGGIATQMTPDHINPLLGAIAGGIVGGAFSLVKYFEQKSNYINALSNLSSYSPNAQGVFLKNVEKLWAKKY